MCILEIIVRDSDVHTGARGWPLEPSHSGAPWFCGGMRLHVLP